MKRLSVLLLALLVTLSFALPASADQPVPWYDEDYAVVWEAGDCSAFGYDFKVMANETGHHSEVLYYDKDHNLVRTVFKAAGTTYLYNEHNSAFTIPSKFNVESQPIFYRWEGDSWWAIRRTTGLFFSFQLPGEGTVVHESGQWLEDVHDYAVTNVLKSVGNATFDMAPLCAALAQ